jgi:class 3 adenylate cyclase/tetratricopeptide (TPR) repeat protein
VSVCSRCGQENPDVARFCLACGASLARGQSAAGRERKVVTVLFADLVGFTSRSESLDPEDVGELLAAYHVRVRQELERHGGTVEKFIGDAVMALFGAPVAHEDDPERAVRAALAIRDAIGELNDEEGRDLRIRTGITTGEALVRLGARPSEGEGMAAGDVVNTAARLQAAAPEDGILIDEATRRATEETIDARAVDPVRAKGKVDPVSAFEVVGARSRFGVDVSQDVRTPLVGRERELELLRGALARVRAERAPQLVTLIGVPGIGKSRLVWELFRIVDLDAELILWRQGRCLPYGEGIAFWALGEMVKAHAGLLETDAAAEAESKLAAAVHAAVGEDEREWVLGHVRPLVGLSGEPGADASEAFAAWRRFFEGLAEQRPLVLVFEDLHWADAGLLDFVDHLVDWAAGVPLLVVCSARPELLERRSGWGGGKLNSTTIALSPLGDGDSARLVAALLDQPLLPAELQQVLLERASGNPLYAEQYVRMLVDRGLLYRGDGGWALAGDEELPLPETLQGIIAARLDGLAPDEKRLLQDAAVFGKVFWLGGVAGSGADRVELEHRLHTLERRGFVRRERRSSVGEEAEYAFTHALVRDVAYGQIPRVERAGKHRAAAEWIETLTAERSADHAQLAAHHWLQALELLRAAGREDPELVARATTALVDGGDRANWLGAIDAARSLYREALDLLPPGDTRRPRLLLGYGNAAARFGIDARAELDEATEALLASGDVEGAADCLLSRSWYLWNVAAIPEAEKAMDRGLELLAGRPPSAVKARFYGEHAVRVMLAGDLDTAIDYAREALALGEQVGLPSQRAHALITIGTARGMRGDEDGLASIQEGLDLARSLNDGGTTIRGYKNLQSLLGLYARIDKAGSVVDDALRVAARFGDGFHVGWFQVEAAFFSYLRGDWDRAIDLLDTFLAALVDRRHYMEGPAHVLRGRILVERGTVEGVRESEDALAFARQVGEHQQLLPALASHAVVLLRLERADEAAPLVDEFLERTTEITHAVVDAALALVLLGRESAFARLAATARSTVWGAAAAAIVDHAFADAAELLAGAGLVDYEAEARLLLARDLAAAGRGEEASREAAAAAAFFRAVGAHPRAADAEAVLRASA